MNVKPLQTLFADVKARDEGVEGIFFEALGHQYRIFNGGKPLNWRYQAIAEKLSQAALSQPEELALGKHDELIEMVFSKVGVVNGKDVFPLSGEGLDEHVVTFPMHSDDGMKQSDVVQVLSIAVFRAINPEANSFFFSKIQDALSQFSKESSEMSSDNPTNGTEQK